MSADLATIRSTEQWFISRGLPHFVQNDSARRDIFSRALPALTLVFIFETFTALNLDWPWWANTLAVAGALAVLVVMLFALNRMRHRRTLSLPATAGAAELILFLFGPPLLPLLFGGKTKLGLATVATNALLLLAIYVVTSYGLVPMTRWAIIKLWHQLGALSRLLTRALPLLLLFVTFLFINPDTWQATSDLYGIYFTSSLLFFALIGAVFVGARMPREIGDLNKFATAEEVQAEIDSTGLALSTDPGVAFEAPMSRRQWGNTSLVVMVSQAIQVLLVGVIVAVFLIMLGMLTIRPHTVDTWIGHHRHVILTVPYGHEHLEITEELLRVSVFLAAFSALYFTVVALTDATYREEFFRDVVSEVRQALAVRLAYLQQVASSRPN